MESVQSPIAADLQECGAADQMCEADVRRNEARVRRWRGLHVLRPWSAVSRRHRKSDCCDRRVALHHRQSLTNGLRIQQIRIVVGEQHVLCRGGAHDFVAAGDVPASLRLADDRQGIRQVRRQSAQLIDGRLARIVDDDD